MKNMKAIDTNVVLRVILQDDTDQSHQAKRLLQSSAHFFVPETVLLESAWVLQSKGLSAIHLARVLRAFLSIENVHVADPSAAAEGIRLIESGMDVGDAMHAAMVKTKVLFTFDKDFIRRALKAGSTVRVEHVVRTG